MAVEPVSLTIGAVSFAFQAFSGCIQAFELIQGARNVGKDASGIQCMLAWAEWRLVAWAKESGLFEDDMRCTASEATLIQSTLAEIQNLLSDTTKLKKRYHLDLRPSTEDELSEQVRIAGIAQIDLGKDQPHSAEGMLNNMVTQQERRRIIEKCRQVQKATYLPKRLFWAACDKENFQNMIKGLHEYIDQLSALLGSRQQQVMERKLDEVMLRTLDISQRVPDLLALMEALNTQASAQPDNDTSTARQLQGVAETKAMHLSLNLDGQGIADETEKVARNKMIVENSKESIKLDAKKLGRDDPENTANEREIGTYDGLSVHIEWKKIRERREIRKLRPRIEALCRLLKAPKPSSFRSLKCLGVIEFVGKDRFALVFETPSWYNPATTANHLKYCLQTEKYQPSASDRLRLALQLCKTILHLHTAGWLHKAIRSSNVTFFDSEKPQNLHSANMLDRPFLVGYEYARFDDPSQLSELQSSSPAVDLYRHPEILGGEPCSFERKHDIYALGLVLLEIAVWAQVQVLVRHFVNIAEEPMNPKIRRVRSFLLGEDDVKASVPALQTVRHHMGDIFAEVVETCLRGTLSSDHGEADGDAPETSVSRFSELVVQKLASCCM